MTIREATVADAAGIARVHVGAWRSAYRGIMPNAVLDNLDESRRKARVESRLGEDADSKPIFVAEDESGTIVGFAWGGPPFENYGDYDRELYALYLLESAQGKGYGRALMEAFVRRMVKDGKRSMMLGVLRDNAKACGFYAHMGGVVVAEGTHTLSMDEDTVLAKLIYGWPDITVLTNRA